MNKMSRSPAAGRRRGKRRFWLSVAGVVLLLAVGAVSAVIQADRARWHTKTVQISHLDASITIACPDGWDCAIEPEGNGGYVYKPQHKGVLLSLWERYILHRNNTQYSGNGVLVDCLREEDIGEFIPEPITPENYLKYYAAWNVPVGTPAYVKTLSHPQGTIYWCRAKPRTVIPGVGYTKGMAFFFLNNTLIHKRLVIWLMYFSSSANEEPHPDFMEMLQRIRVTPLPKAGTDRKQK